MHVLLDKNLLIFYPLQLNWAVHYSFPYIEDTVSKQKISIEINKQLKKTSTKNFSNRIEYY